MRRPTLLIALVVLAAALEAAASPTPIEVTVSEGTSMSVAVSPDGRTLAIDLQGSIWMLPSTGGVATRLTDPFNDARQPTWSPDGNGSRSSVSRRRLRLWSIAPDGSKQRKLTWGPFDDREPAWSHDGTRLAFCLRPRQSPGSDYNIWVMDVATGACTQLTTDPAEDSMPTWSPDDQEIAFVSTRDKGTRCGPCTSRREPSAR